MPSSQAFARAFLVLLLWLIAPGIAAAQAPCGLPPGFVGWWPLNSNANDVAGGDGGSLVGGATYGSGVAGQAVNLDGSTGYVDIPGTAALRPIAAITVVAWINPAGGTAFPPIVKYNGPSDQAGYALEMGSDGQTVFFYVDRAGGGWVGAGGVPVLRGQWSLVAGTYDGQVVRLYVNGVLSASTPAPGTINSPSGDLFIGHDQLNQRYFQGSIDEVGIFNVALPGIALQAIYSAGSGGFCRVFDPANPPVLSLPADISLAGAASGRLVFFNATAWDALDGALPVACAPPSGANFPVGVSTVTCTATNSRSASSTGAFHVTVVLGTVNPTGLLGRWAFDEGGGTVARDSSGNGRDGAVVGATYTSADGADAPSNASALLFNGQSAVVVPDSPALTFSAGDPFTLSFWARPLANAPGSPTNYAFGIAKGGSCGTVPQNADYSFGGNPDGVLLTGQASAGLSDPGAMMGGRLRQVAVSYDGGALVSFYFDGALAATVQGQLAPQPPIAGDLQIGDMIGCAASPGFSGMLDDVRLYNRALSAIEIASLNLSRALEVDYAFGQYNGTTTLSAVLYANGARVRGRTVAFTLGGTAVGTAITDEDGIASLPNVSLAGFDLGVNARAIGATFAGDGTVPGASVTGDLTIIPATPSLVWNQPTLSTTAAGPVDLAAFVAQFSPSAGGTSGTFSYQGPAQLSPGLNDQVCTTFTPTDSVHYQQSSTCIQPFVAVSTSSSSPTAEAMVAVGGWRAVVDSARGVLYVGNPLDGSLSVIDGISDAVVATIPLQKDGLSGSADQVAFDAGANRLYVIDRDQPILWTIDGATRQVLSTTLSSS